MSDLSPDFFLMMLRLGGVTIARKRKNRPSIDDSSTIGTMLPCARSVFDPRIKYRQIQHIFM